LQSSFLAFFVPTSAIQNVPAGLRGVFIIMAALIGLFTWPVFVASLAKKYGR
jgi:hypothetical protein